MFDMWDRFFPLWEYMAARLYLPVIEIIVDFADVLSYFDRVEALGFLPITSNMDGDFLVSVYLRKGMHVRESSHYLHKEQHFPRMRGYPPLDYPPFIPTEILGVRLRHSPESWKAKERVLEADLRRLARDQAALGNWTLLREGTAVK
jgi:hypothetical protein